MSYFNYKNQPEFGGYVIGRPVTATLYVSPDGDNSDGISWARAYTTLNAALDAASTDASAFTTIFLAPKAAAYDIDTTGDPTWAANVAIRGPHRKWAPITNSHASATSILKLTGKSSVTDLAFNQTGAVTGLIMAASAFRIRKCGFNSSACTGAVKGIHIDGTAGTLLGGRIEDVRIIGNVTYTTGLYLDNCSYSDFRILDKHFCLVGIQIVNAASDNNFFDGVDLGGCALAIDIDAGNSQHFTDTRFHENTVNVDDEVGDHHWQNIQGEFPVTVEPVNLTGVEVTCGDEDWGADTELRAAVTSTVPFKVLGYTLAPSHDESTLIRFSADSGTTFFAEEIFASKKGKASAASDSTDYIFNAGTRISASAWSPDSGRTVNVWLEIQEI